ncbi:MAG: hypothetical protein KJP23_25965 [Deltaproteobacteria bacterium]|nr:hypothetical protein [Deltaproteobacteria bacterium]
MKHEFNLHTIAHGIEIVQSHFPGWKFHAVDTIADSALHATLLVGEPQYVNRLGPRVTSDLERFAITLLCDGNVCERGRGSNALGSPLVAVAHLIGVIAKQPHSIYPAYPKFIFPQKSDISMLYVRVPLRFAIIFSTLVSNHR